MSVQKDRYVPAYSKPFQECIFFFRDLLELGSHSLRQFSVVVGVVFGFVAAQMQLWFKRHFTSLLQQQVPVYKLVKTVVFNLLNRL